MREDPYELSPRQLYAHAVLAHEEEVRRDERQYFVMTAAATVAPVTDKKDREKLDKILRKAIRGEE